ncbi:hypothetical protein DL93DRAFT_2224851 [Clavulina sp. PMI_390]|nr:hypothetical protein DL93DRAFT_2224851 [Clavulina sp. PMI_390]
MSATSQADVSLLVKAQADAAYRAKNYVLARKLYTQALETTELPALRSNLAAAEFELGQYDVSAENSQKVVDLLGDSAQTPNPGMRVKNEIRVLRCLAITKKSAEALPRARALVTRLSGHEGLEELKTMASLLLESMERLDPSPVPTQRVASDRLIQLPNYRPASASVMEHFVVGEDKPESLLGAPRSSSVTEETIGDFNKLKILIPEPSLLGAEPWDFSALMLGAGDPRHLYATLLDISVKFVERQHLVKESEVKYPPKNGVGIHITMNDIRPYAIARHLVILYALEEISQHNNLVDPQVPSRQRELLTMLHFVFWSCGMPPKVHVTMMEIIRRVRDGPHPSCVVLDDASREQINPCLDYWLGPMSQQHELRRMTRSLRAGKHPSETIAELSAMGVDSTDEFKDNLRESRKIEQEILPPGSRREKASFPILRVLWPPEYLVPDEALELREFFAAEYARKTELKPATPLKDLQLAHDNILETWFCNVTFLTDDWAAGDYNHDTFKQITWLFDDVLPWALQLAPSGPNATIHQFSCLFFDLAADGVRALSRYARSFKIELIVDDALHVVDQIRFGNYEGRRDGPVLFDRIHLSNLPDYTGGVLTSFTSCAGILRTHERALITFNCLLNAGLWSAQFTNEAAEEALQSYVYNYSGVFLEEIETVFGMKRELPHLLLSHYMAFTKVPSSPDKLVSRERLTVILHEAFLRSVLATRWRSRSMSSMREPLNMLAFFRFVEMLCKRGYPYHWISETIEGFFTGRIRTRVRPAPSRPAPIPRMPRLHADEALLFLTPFMLELQTTAAIWAPLLPFSLTAPGLPPISEICTCQVHVPMTIFFSMMPTAVHRLVLKFVSSSQTASPTINLDLRDEATSSEVAFISTLHYAHSTRIATFYLAQGSLEELKRQGWEVLLWSFVDDGPASDPLPCTSINIIGDVDSWASAVQSATTTS